ncbi:MAG: UDP-N-acetylglucosamine--N-acetylmuramyl-(pentapeptide) pyrophosphoryl-undecaprenol N-acetylglucosamine transferase, partial [Gammaproteobacteria bacterium]
THQTGEQDLIITKDLYLQLNPNHAHQIISFIDDMSKAYQAANLVICRAGASTIFEILASNSASILIPLPGAIDDHQTKNALYLVNHNAAILVNQNELTVDKLKNLIIELKNNPNKINSLKEAAKSLYKQYAKCNSSHMISELILDL